MDSTTTVKQYTVSAVGMHKMQGPREPVVPARASLGEADRVTRALWVTGMCKFCMKFSFSGWAGFTVMVLRTR